MEERDDSGVSGEESAPEERPPEPKKESEKNPAGAPESGQQQRSSQLDWGTVIGILVAIVGIIVAVRLDGDGTSSFADPGDPRLERVDLIARNGFPPQRPALELLVRNGGNGRSVVSRARIEILRVYRLSHCYSQGGLSVSERYGVQLSSEAKPGERVEVPLHQQVGINRADRFRIDLGLSDEEEDDAPRDLGAPRDLYLFEVAVALIHDDRETPLPMGDALISLPSLPFSQYLLEEGGFKKAVEVFGPYDKPVREVWSEPLSCWQANARTAARARMASATRSPQLEEILATAVAPSFSEIEG